MIQKIMKIHSPIKSNRLFCSLGALLAATMLCSCASAAKKADMRVWSEKNTKEGTILVRYPKDRLQIVGSVHNENDEPIFYVEGVQWFSNWHDGWTEAFVLASGKARLDTSKGKRISAEFIDPVQLEESQEAAIRYRDTILRGNDARVAFSRRLDRISAAVEFVTERSTKAEKARISEKKAFMHYMEQELFPEVFGFPKGIQESSKVPENRERGEGINWDIRYTESIFPAEFAAIRNSGTLFRDWEETADLFYFIFCMESMKND